MTISMQKKFVLKSSSICNSSTINRDAESTKHTATLNLIVKNLLFHVIRSSRRVPAALSYTYYVIRTAICMSEYLQHNFIYF